MFALQQLSRFGPNKLDSSDSTAYWLDRDRSCQLVIKFINSWARDLFDRAIIGDHLIRLL